MTIPERVKLLRKDHLGLSQSDFGDQLGVSRDTINNIERQRIKNEASNEPIYRLICEKYNVRDAWLRNGEEPVFDDAAREEQIYERLGAAFGGNEAYAKRFAAALARLNTEDWEAIVRIAQKLKEGAE